MTDTERIATALLGWHFVGRQFNNYECDLYSKIPGTKRRDATCVSVIRKTGKSEGGFGMGWPDFTTLDGCRLFEDALFAKLPAGCYRYGQIITMIRLEFADFDGPPLFDSCLKATPAQRVAACLKVLDEAGL